MAPDKFTEVTSQGWLSRLMESIKSVAVGVVLFFIAFPLLFWNEGRAVKRAQDIQFGRKNVVSISADKVDSQNDKKLVHLTGEATTGETLTDSLFGVSANAIKLMRVAQMYQWEEKSESKTKKKLGGGTETTTEYTYDKTWSADVIKSSEFKHPEDHTNPTEMAYKSETQTAQKVTLGAFTLPESLVNRIDKTEPLPVAAESVAPLKKSVGKEIGFADGGYYIGKDSANPAIGDVKIKFELVKPMNVSIVAGQINDTLEPFPAKNGMLEELQLGTVSADMMFKAAEEENAMMTWILRLVGFLMMLFGIVLVFKPLTTMADVLPFLGDILGLGIGIFAGIISFGLSLIVISIAWVFYRPLIGIPMLVIGVGAVVALKVIGKKKQAAV